MKFIREYSIDSACIELGRKKVRFLLHTCQLENKKSFIGVQIHRTNRHFFCNGRIIRRELAFFLSQCEGVEVIKKGKSMQQFKMLAL